MVNEISLLESHFILANASNKLEAEKGDGDFGGSAVLWTP